jgi:membrane protein DedA with SNARE-associated domain
MQDWVVDIVRQLGVAGIALLMFAENIFPPLPSEIIMPLAGYLSTREELSFWGSVVAGTLGSLAGATVWFVIGRRLNRDQLCARVETHGAWWAMTTDDVDRAVDWFHGHGRFSVLLGRLVPVVRTLISVPAGFSRMSWVTFLLLSGLGTAVWTVALAFAGRFLGERFDQIDRFVGPVSWIVIAAAILTYVVRVIRIRRSAG